MHGTPQTFKEWRAANLSTVQAVSAIAGTEAPTPSPEQLPEKNPVDEAQLPAPSHGRRPRFEMAVPDKQGTATAVLDEDSGKFIVLKGSPARNSWKGPLPGNEHLKLLRDELMNNGILTVGGDGICRFTRDYPFASTSAAAKVVAGAPRSGPAAWKVHGTPQTFKEWRAANLSTVQAVSAIAGTEAPTPSPEQPPEFEMSVPHSQGIATAVYDEGTGRIKVLAGSRARGVWTRISSRYGRSKRLRDRLLEDGTLEIEADGSCNFTRDYEFGSVSAAAEIVAGGSRNGRRAWKVRGTSQTFEDWEARKQN